MYKKYNSKTITTVVIVNVINVYRLYLLRNIFLIITIYVLSSSEIS